MSFQLLPEGEDDGGRSDSDLREVLQSASVTLTRSSDVSGAADSYRIQLPDTG